MKRGSLVIIWCTIPEFQSLRKTMTDFSEDRPVSQAEIQTEYLWEAGWAILLCSCGSNSSFTYLYCLEARWCGHLEILNYLSGCKSEGSWHDRSARGPCRDGFGRHCAHRYSFCWDCSDNRKASLDWRSRESGKSDWCGCRWLSCGLRR
jgi:hypothetical protein